MRSNREFDIIVYGATGFTGRLVCEYLYQQYGVDGVITWAMGGRSADKLVAVRDAMGIATTVPLVVVDPISTASVTAMVTRARVLVNIVGPYQLYGSDVVQACVAAATDYVDLCGEPGWMHEMILAHLKTAKATGSRIVFSCGFDSIPSDLGTFFVQQAAKAKWGAPASRVKGRLRAMKGSFSGGTIASLKASMEAAAKRPELKGLLRNPFALTPGFTGPEQPSATEPIYDEDLNSWSAPFVLAFINVQNIHRSNFLMGHPYGKNFLYDEMVLTGPGKQGEIRAKQAAVYATDDAILNERRQPGEGPPKEERETGRFDFLYVASNKAGETIRASVKGDRDPGYGSTSKMVAESAVCLVKNHLLMSGGLWTPAAAMGAALIERLQSNAGLVFALED